MVDKLLRLIKVLTTLPDIDEAIDCFLHELASHYEAERAYIIEYDLAHNVLNNTYEWCAPGTLSGMEMLQGVELSVVDAWNRRFEAQGEFYISSLHQELDKTSRDFQLLEMQGVSSLMCAPLMRQGTIIGFLGVDNPRAKVISTELLRATVDFLTVELEKGRMIRQAEELASTDFLTGVRNRRSYVDMLRKIEHNPPGSIGFIYADINGLTRINEIFGYDVGDAAIRKTAQVLRQYAGEQVYRLDGDEFAAVFTDLDRAAFDDLCAQVRNTYAMIPDFGVAVGSSLVECHGRGYVNLQPQYAKVYEMMSADKMQLYIDTRYAVGLHKRADLTLGLLQEIEDGRFHVYIQPQVDLETGHICGAEALVRKTDDEGRLLPPQQFLPKYELLDLQMHVDRFALESSIRMLAEVPADKRRGISVNLSLSMVRTPNLTAEVEALLSKYRLEPHYLTLEITEGVAKMGVELVENVVRRLRAIGVKVALDDLGTEYANLNVLIAMDFDEVKLSKCLIDNVCTDSRSQTVLRNVIRMCRELGSARIVAEGVETYQQRNIVKALGCSHGQGFLFHNPMPMEKYVSLLNEESPCQGTRPCIHDT